MSTQNSPKWGPFKQIDVIVVGCGGTYYQLCSYLDSWLRRAWNKEFRGLSVSLVDPDTVDRSERQWGSQYEGMPKVEAARARMEPPHFPWYLFDSRVQNTTVHPYALKRVSPGSLFVVLGLVDNDEARRFMYEDCPKRKGLDAVVFFDAGCSRDYGQVFTSVWVGQKEYHSSLGLLRATPSEVKGGDIQECDQQTSFANLMTATLVARRLESLLVSIKEERVLGVRPMFWESMGANGLRTFDINTIPTGGATNV